MPIPKPTLSLSDFFKSINQPLQLSPYLTGIANSTPNFLPTSRTLPNGGGSYTAVTPNMTPDPNYTPGRAAASIAAAKPVASAPAPTPRVFSAAPAPSPAPAPTAPAQPQIPQSWIDPRTGQPYPANVIANNIVSTLPGQRTNGDVPQYAGNVLTQGPQSAADLTGTLTRLNNARNDIAVGETDPYGVGNQSGVPYTAAELNAIQKAYAGVYDPAIESAKAKLDQKQKEDTAAATAKQKIADTIFQTNENIRQWKATTGSQNGSTDNFTNSQTNQGASNAGLDIATFKALDPEVKNFYINSPAGTDPDTDKSAPLYKIFAKDIAAVKAGTGGRSADDVVNDITNSNLPASVKQYFINQVPATPAKKAGYLDTLWRALTGQI